MRTKEKRQPDFQRRCAMTHCSLCDRELYEGDSYWYINGSTVCENCLDTFAKSEFAAHRQICGQEVTP